MSTTSPNVHPMVKVGAAAHFQLYNRTWHRTEHFPSRCLCDTDPMTAVVVKPSIDDSWRYAPDSTWGPCISRLMRDERMQEGTMLGGKMFQIGMRVALDPKAQALYDQGGSGGEWYLEALGHDSKGEPAPIAKIRERVTQVYAWAPMAWISEWTDQAKESSVVDMRETETPLKARIPLKPTDDSELTCIFCHRGDCTHEIDVRLPGQRAAFGIHGACVRGVVGVEIT